MKRWRPHRTTVLIVAISVAGAIGASGFAQQVHDDNEQQLLEAQADQGAQLLSSAGGEWVAHIETVAVLAAETDGDRQRMAEHIAADEGLNGWSWAVLRSSGDELERVPVRPTDEFGVDIEGDHEVSAEVMAALEADDTTLLGLLGSGLDRRFVFVLGTPGAEQVRGVYAEISLVEIGSSDDSDDSDDGGAFSNMAFALYEGTEQDPDKRILQFGDTDTAFTATEVIDIANSELLLLAGGDGGLTGALAERLPLLLLVALIAAGLLVAAVNEVAERRADNALGLVTDLEEKNAALDRAIVDREEAATRREQAERELWRAQRLEAVGQLAGGVAHDFNNLLAAITSYAELAAENIDDPEIRDDLDQIRNSARRGAGLTRQLLLFARSSTDDHPIANVQHVFHDIDGLVRSAAGTPTHLVLEIDDGLPDVAVGPTALEQIVLNLVVNARHAIDEGGHIDITVRSHGDDSVELTVRDDGTGMEPAVAERAFEPFFSTKTDSGGSGLGLSTVYGIVTRAGGSVQIDSEVGAGTTITTVLPAASSAAARPVEGSAEPPPQLSEERCRVLLVDDEDAVRNATARLLRRRGYDVTTAASGREALDLLVADSFEVVVTDLLMPGTATGRVVLEELARSHPSTASVVITGYSGSDTTDDIGSLVLTKPFTDAELADAIEDARRGKVVTG